MKKFLRILFAFGFSCIVILAQENPQEAGKNNPISNLLYIGFEKSTTSSQRINILKQASVKVVEEVDLMDYPIFCIEIENNPAEATKIKEQLENEDGVIFVTDDMDLNEKQILAANIKRQGEVSISNTKDLNEESKRYYHQLILNHMPGLDVCVKKYFPEQKHNVIKALYHIVIDKKGAVKEVRLLESNIKSPQLRACLKNKIQQWRDFPRRKEIDELSLKFRFSY